jgi:hypothetical protein
LGGVDRASWGFEVLGFLDLGGGVRLHHAPSVSIFFSNPPVDRFEALSSNLTGTGVNSGGAMRPADHFIERSV